MTKNASQINPYYERLKLVFILTFVVWPISFWLLWFVLNIRLWIVLLITLPILALFIISTFSMPTWKDPDRDIRKAAVERMVDQTILVEIARTDADACIRKAAVKKLKEPSILAEIAKTDENMDACIAAVEKLNDPVLLADIAKTKTGGILSYKHMDAVSLVALEKITDQVLFSDSAKSAHYTSVRKAATNQLTSQALLTVIATTDKSPAVRKVAVQQLSDQLLLADIAKNDCAEEVSLAAILALSDDALLLEIATSAGYERHYAAIERLAGRSLLTVTDPRRLMRLADETEDSRIRDAAIAHLPRILREGLNGSECDLAPAQQQSLQSAREAECKQAFQWLADIPSECALGSLAYCAPRRPLQGYYAFYYRSDIEKALLATLVARGPAVIPLLLSRPERDRTHKFVVDVLVELGDPRTVDYLLNLLIHPRHAEIGAVGIKRILETRIESVSSNDLVRIRDQAPFRAEIADTSGYSGDFLKILVCDYDWSAIRELAIAELKTR